MIQTGYQTDFSGEFTIDPPLPPEVTAAINAFCSERHEEDFQKAHGLEFSYYCQWLVEPAGDSLSWDGSEKFYEYEVWLQYLLDTFIIPSGVVMEGDVTWDGEEQGDVGMLSVKDNVLTVKQGRIVYD